MRQLRIWFTRKDSVDETKEVAECIECRDRNRDNRILRRRLRQARDYARLSPITPHPIVAFSNKRVTFEGGQYRIWRKGTERFYRIPEDELIPLCNALHAVHKFYNRHNQSVEKDEDNIS